MVSVERVLSYCKVPQEASLESEKDNKPPNDWPATGNIEVQRNWAVVAFFAAAYPTPPRRLDALYTANRGFPGSGEDK